MRRIIVACVVAMGGVLATQQEASAFHFRMSFDWEFQCGGHQRNGGYCRRQCAYVMPLVFHDFHNYGYAHAAAQPTEKQSEQNSTQTTGYSPAHLTNYGNGGMVYPVGYQQYSRPVYPSRYYYPYPYYGGYYAAPYYWYGN